MSPGSCWPSASSAPGRPRRRGPREPRAQRRPPRLRRRRSLGPWRRAAGGAVARPVSITRTEARQGRPDDCGHRARPTRTGETLTTFRGASTIGRRRRPRAAPETAPRPEQEEREDAAGSRRGTPPDALAAPPPTRPGASSARPAMDSAWRRACRTLAPRPDPRQDRTTRRRAADPTDDDAPAPSRVMPGAGAPCAATGCGIPGDHDFRVRPA
jgi:hypothetical protein